MKKKIIEKQALSGNTAQFIKRRYQYRILCFSKKKSVLSNVLKALGARWFKIDETLRLNYKHHSILENIVLKN